MEKTNWFMNKPVNKKKCSGCEYYTKMRYKGSEGENFSICSADYRVDDSGKSCKYWKGKKYKRIKKPNRKLKKVLL